MCPSFLENNLQIGLLINYQPYGEKHKNPVKIRSYCGVIIDPYQILTVGVM